MRPNDKNHEAFWMCRTCCLHNIPCRHKGSCRPLHQSSFLPMKCLSQEALFLASPHLSCHEEGVRSALVSALGDVGGHLQATQKPGAGTKAKQAPREGRGQRQRRKKREGAGSPGQSAGQQQAILGAQSSQPAGRSWASNDNGAAGVGAGQERPPKKMRPALKDAGKLTLTTQSKHDDMLHHVPLLLEASCARQDFSA